MQWCRAISVRSNVAPFARAIRLEIKTSRALSDEEEVSACGGMRLVHCAKTMQGCDNMHGQDEEALGRWVVHGVNVQRFMAPPIEA